LAAALCAEVATGFAPKENQGPSPEALKYAFQAEAYKTLPNNGGLRDQPVGLMTQMKVCMNVYNAVKGYLGSNMSIDWIQRNQELYGIFNIVQQIKKEVKK